MAKINAMTPMKSILLATDFSDHADNALAYALKMAEFLEAKLYILHVCRISSASTAAYPAGYYDAVDTEELRREASLEMEQLKKSTLVSTTVTYECMIRSGQASEIIQEVAQKISVDVIVMGTRWATGLAEWLGSVTSDVVEKSSRPVLAIPVSIRFKPPREFLLTTTLTKLSSLTALDQIKQIVHWFNAKLDILHIRPYEKELSSEQQLFWNALENYLSDTPHFLHTVAYDDISEGIHHYLSQHETDILTMIPQQRNFIEQLFRASKTRHMLFHTKIPLLAICD
ncbi:MAG: universal stress protein [Bacteroidota bacterium]